MPIWPFGGDRRDDPPAPQDRPASPLDTITETTPHRFRIWLARADVQPALSALRASRWFEQEATVVLGASRDDGAIPLEIASSFSPRTAAILRPLNVLNRAGVPVAGLEALDLVTDVSEDALAAAVAAWDRDANRGPHRHRLEVLAGRSLLERCLEHLERAKERGPNGRHAWWFAAMCIAFNTDGAEDRLLAAAVATADDGFVEMLIVRAQATRLAGSDPSVPEEPLAALIRTRSYAGERAARLASQLASPLPERVTAALCDAAARGGEAGEAAVGALANAAPTRLVREALERVLESGQPNVMAAALGSLAVHWPAEARPVWRRFLASRSIPLRWAAEEVLGRHGTEEDLPEAVAHLAKLIRTKSATHMTPPRGADIVALLLRHSHDARARAGLDDLSARWDRLPDDMRQWLEQHHPELHPEGRDGTAPAELEAVESEEALFWPPPTIEREDDALMIWFEEGAHHSRTRDRFEELALADPKMEVLDGDREWMRVRTDAADPERHIRELWEAAGPA